LTVPLTASSPIEPPGKRSGLTTKLSVRHRQTRALDLDDAGVAELGERATGLGECRHEQSLDQRLRGLAAGAVGERDLGVAEAGALGARRLDDLEHALLAPAGQLVGGGAHTTSLVRARRP
jgi:hypothetical protein